MKSFKICFIVIGLLLFGLSFQMMIYPLQLTTAEVFTNKIVTQTGIASQETEFTKIKSSTHTLPSEIIVGGVFPIVKRPDAGRDRRDAFLLAIYEINNQTGANRILPTGVNLKPIVKDDDNSAAGGAQAALELIAAGVDIVIGSSGSNISEAIATKLTPYKIPQISYASTSPTLSNRTNYPYFMRVCGSDADQAVALVDLTEAFNWSNGAIIHTDDSYGSGAPTVFTELFEDADGTILTDQSFTPGTTDVSTEIQAIKNAAPEFVLAWGVDADIYTIMKEAKTQAIDTLPWLLPMPSTFTGDSDAKAAMQKAIGTRGVFTGPAYTAFNATWFDPAWNWLEGPAHSQSTGTAFDYPGGVYAAFAYDAVYVAAKGLAKAGTTDGNSLLTALYDVTHEGASGSIEFNDLGEVYQQYDYLQFIDMTFESFGGWVGTPSFKTGTLALHDGSSWMVLNNRVTRLTVHGSILISSNTVLNASFPGIGTIDDPILIEGYNITDSGGTLVSISDTTFYFHITNCLFNGMTTIGNGIFFSNVFHGTIDNNIIIKNGWKGIYLDTACSNITISNNFIYDNNEDGMWIKDTSNNNIIVNNTIYNNGKIGGPFSDGIRITSSHDNKIDNNTIYNNSANGILISSSENNTLTNNKIYNNDADGVNLDTSDNTTITGNRVFVNDDGLDIYSSMFTTISNNTINDNKGAHGIGLNDLSNYNTVSNNTISNNAYVGIDIKACNYTLISKNLIYNSGEDGIRLKDFYGNNIYSYHNTIINNIIHSNGWNGIHLLSHQNNIEMNDFRQNNNQVSDDGSENVVNSNFYADWTGIGSYSLAGSAGNFDSSPLLNPFHLSAPIVTSPTTATPILKDGVTIQWTASSDTFGHTITYSISYSTDNGVTWKELVTGLTSSIYTWDTMTIYDGQILLKVESIDSESFVSKTISGPFIIDNHLPIVTIDSPLNRKYTSGTITVIFKGDADVMFWYYIELVDSQNQTWITSVTRTLSDGTYTLHAYGNDSAGNIAHASVTFIIEILIPTTTTITAPSATTTISSVSSIIIPSASISTPGMTILVFLAAMFVLILKRKEKM